MKHPIAIRKEELESPSFMWRPRVLPGEFMRVEANLRVSFAVVWSALILVALTCALRLPFVVCLIGIAAGAVVTWLQCVSAKIIYRYYRPYFKFPHVRHFVELAVGVAIVELLITAFQVLILIGYCLGWIPAS